MCGGCPMAVPTRLSTCTSRGCAGSFGETAQQPRYLHTVRGVGIKLSPPAPAARPSKGQAGQSNRAEGEPLRIVAAGGGHDLTGARLVPGAARAGAAHARGRPRGSPPPPSKLRPWLRWLSASLGPSGLRLAVAQVNAASSTPVTVFLPDGTADRQPGRRARRASSSPAHGRLIQHRGRRRAWRSSSRSTGCPAAPR